MTIWRNKNSVGKEKSYIGDWCDSIYRKLHIAKEINNLKVHKLNEKELNFPGVYVLKTPNNIIYIGSSRYLFVEIKASIRKCLDNFNDKIELVDIYLMNNYKHAEFLEYYLIDKYKPLRNVTNIELDVLSKRNQTKKEL